MKKLFRLFLLFSLTFSYSQTDFSGSWEDFYSYNNVKDFVKVETKFYAVVDNAVFTYDTATQELEKLSSVQGLSGETATSIHFSENLEKLVIGYQTGLIEVVDSEGKITISNDIERLSITGEKQINDITEFDSKLYLATPFAIVVYDLENLEFGDTFFIGAGSSEVVINQIEIFQETIFAATETGIFTADVNNPSLIDFNNWGQPQGNFLGNFETMEVFDNRLFTSRDTNFYEVLSTTTLQFIATMPQQINDLKSSSEFITVATNKQAQIFNTSLALVVVSNAILAYDYVLNSAFAENQTIYLGTTEFGILERSFSDSVTHVEIHPEGPSANDIFSITAQNNNLWVVYGAYDDAFTPIQSARGFSHFNNGSWTNISYNPAFPARDLVHVTIDQDNENKVYISSWGQTDPGNLNATGGLLIVENNEVIDFLNQDNSGLESVMLPSNPNYRSVRVNGTAFDNQGNLWVTNGFIDNRLKKRAANGTWSSFDLSSIVTNEAFGLTELRIDRTGSIWIGTRRNGVLVYNETGDRKRALITEATKGSLPDANTRTLAIDRNNRIWIGTKRGLVVYSNAAGIFDEAIIDAFPVIIDDNGIPKRLLGDQPINSIAIDGADNKWFGTDTGGVLGTNPSGQETLFIFNKDNSPLPSNRILKIQVDNSTGKVFFATDKGIVAFDNNVSPFGDELGEVYAYPNPVRREHNFVTIDGRNDTNLPRGTNVKILDAAGRLVHETNVIEGQELKGGKVIWDKTNLAGRKVASGIYIVLLTTPDRSETSSTKIAIIN